MRPFRYIVDRIFPMLTQQHPLLYASIYFLLLIPAYAVIYGLLPANAISCGYRPCDWISAVYFSITTITTLGYGDIWPTNAVGQTLAGSEAVLGVMTVGLFLNSLSHHLSHQVQQRERDRVSADAYAHAHDRLRRYDRLVHLRIESYLRATIAITTPRDQWHTITVYPNHQVNQDFSLADMHDLFGPTPWVPDHHTTPAIVGYFQAEQRLADALRDLIQHVDLYHWPALETCCLQFLAHHAQFDYRDYLLARTRDADAIAIDRALIIDHKGAVNYQRHHPKNAYVALYHLIKQHLQCIEHYRQQLATIFPNDTTTE